MLDEERLPDVGVLPAHSISFQCATHLIFVTFLESIVRRAWVMILITAGKWQSRKDAYSAEDGLHLWISFRMAYLGLPT